MFVHIVTIGTDGDHSMSTRKLILASLVLGVVILVAFAAQLLIAR
jgi:hypothetical protein